MLFLHKLATQSTGKGQGNFQICSTCLANDSKTRYTKLTHKNPIQVTIQNKNNLTADLCNLKIYLQKAS